MSKAEAEASKTVAAEIAAMSFEQAMAALEEIVDRLESGDAPLEESIALYEKGAALKAQCEKRLRDAELRVEKIVQGEDGGAAGLAPFPTE
ncbi:MAG: exodeoxyribonuclease VII small subunit [Rubrimonas sp.]|uniref:exodeoxyribonuclease VII small subunit n=1 Tax=Rubrimonas sp. TaxID=2036015 RepID=UPI002FDE2847